MELTRRSFLKTGALAAAAAGTADVAFAGLRIAPAEATETIEEKTAYTYHPPDCGGRCSFECLVRDGKLVRILPNPHWENKEFCTVCVRGLSEVQSIYGDNRIQKPLKRVGERGSNEFEAISWDQALQEIHDAIEDTQATYGPDSVSFGASFSGGGFNYLPTLLGASLMDGMGIDTGIANGLDPTTGDYFFYGAMQSEVRDWQHSKNIVLFSCNPCESIMTTTRLIFDAIEKGGAKLTVIDPMLSTTASKADKWIPITQGTDLAMLLAMITAILDNEWYHTDFMLANTSAPFLVDVETGMQLRDHDDPTGEEMGDTNPFMVWDNAARKAVSYLEAKDPALEGEFDVDGRKVKTVFTLLKESQSQYTLDWASEYTSVPVEDIVEVARAIACDGPAVIGAGWGGLDKMANSDVVGHCIGLLASITGNSGVHGSSFGILGEQFVDLGTSAAMGGWALPEEFAPAELPGFVDALRHEDANIHMLIQAGNVFYEQFAAFEQTTDWLQTMDCIVSVAPFYNDSTKWSDYVLPACTWAEKEGDHGKLTVFHCHALLQQKIIEPLFEAKTDFQIELELARLFGLDQYLPQSTDDEIRAQLDTDDPAFAGITLEALDEHFGIMQLNVDTEPYLAHQDQVYYTASGRLQFYHDENVGVGQQLPQFAENNEIGRDNPLAETYPFQFAQTHSRFHCHSQYMENAWLMEIDGGPQLEMSVADAAEKGLQTGDTVEVFNDRGSMKALVKVNNCIRPGVVRMHEGWYSGMMIDGNLQSLTNSFREQRQEPMTYGAVIPYNDTRVDVRKA